MKFDEWHHPISQKVYDVAFVLRDVTTPAFLHMVEPWATGGIFVPVEQMHIAEEYLKAEQPTTNIDLSKRIQPFDTTPPHDVVLEFSEKDFVQNGSDSMAVLNNLNEMLGQVENNGVYEYGIFRLSVGELTDLAPTLIKI